MGISAGSSQFHWLYGILVISLCRTPSVMAGFVPWDVGSLSRIAEMQAMWLAPYPGGRDAPYFLDDKPPPHPFPCSSY
ncbi:hypothetical protein B0H15DRAFT_815376 [Mycena belliarum]|uniref:Secreted protein n=1 Tax=Mycena belliarum TaxID=1033014 RepID=A0AAD6UIT6_9AGAR|nr:hypothetical protein B0H15DRAFT_815376 [Mycena belliae]